MTECIDILNDPMSKHAMIYGDEKYFYQSFNSIFIDLVKLPVTDKIMDFFHDFVGSFIAFNHNKLRYEKNDINKEDYEHIKDEYDMLLEKQEDYFNDEFILDEEPSEEYIESLANQSFREFNSMDDFQRFVAGERAWK